MTSPAYIKVTITAEDRASPVLSRLSDRLSEMFMLYTQRVAYARMNRPRRFLHRLLWAAYQPVSKYAIPRRMWGMYRATWPRPPKGGAA